ncbi:alpha/beta fold hydrolase [Thermomonospora curvata]|uniref:Alpha/beta hydrolase fold protein n=1 Tax=Thermomonospora curvata (strain ATCC 19995 / DSM 43183 / JCM 3096 / KCTC 9072 / NBRC 15933 / NCIMB 10081 / Henssen B9) TaxID=471852 RepID=D1A7D3_THECD|nr:alpha/beta hydrolase [Thermomonospora curvata]ACZ00339.1 alpha/beta hydrolase fold protein [Thermomonospora curvata DSM 43183]
MIRFPSYDGAHLAVHPTVQGGPPLVCLPGGPGRASRYLGDLGGLSRHRRLLRLDLRGSGYSASGDPAGYRCDRMVADVEALRVHLGLERMDLLAHSAAGNLALLYAARHPERLRRLVLVTPDARAVGICVTERERRAVLRRRADEPWYEDACKAITAWRAGEDTPAIRLEAAPFRYGRWNEAAFAHARCEEAELARSRPVAAGYYAEGAFDPALTRRALACLQAPVLVIAGALDPDLTPERAAELARLFPDGRLVVDDCSAHFPWVTMPRWFTKTVHDFLR